MSSTFSLRDSLRYLLLRANPFSDHAWVRHRASGLWFRIHRRDDVGRRIARSQNYEPELTAWLLGVLGAQAAGSVFVDIGANLGWFSLNAARLPQLERVIAFEPDAGNHALLQSNIERNQLQHRIDAVACALGAGPGLARLNRYKASNLGRHSIAADHGRGGSWVPVESLDTMLDRLQLAQAPIGAIKIDVEGYEPAVIAGAQRTLQRANAVLIELSPELSRAGGLDLQQMLSAIGESGFVPQIWDQPGPVPDLQALRARQAQCTVGFGRRSG